MPAYAVVRVCCGLADLQRIARVRPTCCVGRATTRDTCERCCLRAPTCLSCLAEVSASAPCVLRAPCCLSLLLLSCSMAACVLNYERAGSLVVGVPLLLAFTQLGCNATCLKEALLSPGQVLRGTWSTRPRCVGCGRTSHMCACVGVRTNVCVMCAVCKQALGDG